MIVSLLLPIALLGGAAVLVPRTFERLLPETMTGLALGAVLSALTLWLLASAGFALLYMVEDTRILTLLADIPSKGFAHFLRLGANAALIWGPVLLLVVSTAPRRWKTAVW